MNYGGQVASLYRAYIMGKDKLWELAHIPYDGVDSLIINNDADSSDDPVSFFRKWSDAMIFEKAVLFLRNSF